MVLHPDLTDETGYPTRRSWLVCAPFVSDEASVQPIWQQLTERAARDRATSATARDDDEMPTCG